MKEPKLKLRPEVAAEFNCKLTSAQDVVWQGRDVRLSKINLEQAERLVGLGFHLLERKKKPTSTK